MTKYCPGGSYLAFLIKPAVSRDRPLIDIGYKYNAQNIISFSAMKYEGGTKDGITYLYG